MSSPPVSLRIKLLFVYLGLVFLVACGTIIALTQAPTNIASQNLTTTTRHTPISSVTQVPTRPSADILAAPSETLTVDLPIVMVSPTITPTLTEPPAPQTMRFAVIGDYGWAGQAEADVASLVISWQPDVIITTGDNNYPLGAQNTIDANIGQYYHSFIYPYLGSYGPGADHNRFFPSLGNHDWLTTAAQPYLDYFNLPGNERYYEFSWGPVHFFALDSDSHEPDGVGSSSAQAAWLQDGLAAAEEPWKIVYMHHPPYSSGIHGSIPWMRWPFQEWGATAVLAGHDHTYERILLDGFPYFVNGLGGGSIYAFSTIVSGSRFRYNRDHGAMLVEADQSSITFSFYRRTGEQIDTFTINHNNAGSD